MQLLEILQDLIIEAKLCPRGRAYYNKRRRAGEKSSAYLSGRAVQVCNGRIKKKKRKKLRRVHEQNIAECETCGYVDQNDIELDNFIYEADPKEGTGKKPKGSDRRLYTDENPKDTVHVKFKTVKDIRDTLSKESFKSKPHARQSQIINLIQQRLKAAYENAKNPDVKERLKHGLDFINKIKEASKRKTEKLKKEKQLKESLHDWFTEEDWVRIDTQGDIAGPCGTMKKGRPTTRCLPRAKAESLSKEERAATSRKKVAASKKGKQFVSNTKKAKVRLKRD